MTKTTIEVEETTKKRLVDIFGSPGKADYLITEPNWDHLFTLVADEAELKKATPVGSPETLSATPPAEPPKIPPTTEPTPPETGEQDDRPFKCPDCDADYTREQDLKSHFTKEGHGVETEPEVPENATPEEIAAIMGRMSPEQLAFFKDQLNKA